MLGDQHKASDTQFKCGFCGFVYREFEEAEMCELNCVTHALASVEMKEHRLQVANC
jgi:hypothetical protein